MKGVADQSRTGVIGKDSRNPRLVINFLYKREHNRLVKEPKKDVKQMQCTEATAHLLDHTSYYLIDMFEEAENHFGAAKCKEI